MGAGVAIEKSFGMYCICDYEAKVLHRQEEQGEKSENFTVTRCERENFKFLFAAKLGNLPAKFEKDDRKYEKLSVKFEKHGKKYEKHEKFLEKLSAKLEKHEKKYEEIYAAGAKIRTKNKAREVAQQARFVIECDCAADGSERRPISRSDKDNRTMPEEIEFDAREAHESVEEGRHGHGGHPHDPAAPDWTRFISLSTAVLAVIAAIGALQSGTLVNEALLEANKAVEAQAKASDTWAYYQAKGIKGNTAKQTADLLAANSAPNAATIQRYRSEAERYNGEQDELKHQADEREKERDEHNKESEHYMHKHHNFAYCVTFTQVAIALSAIAALTRRRNVWYGSMAIGAIGLGLLLWGFFGH